MGVDSLTLEHVTPLARGGTNSVGNLVLACSRCNTSKRHRFLIVWPNRPSMAEAPVRARAIT